MNRLTRHIVSEIIELFLAILIGLVVVLLSFRFAALLSEAASGKIVGSAIFKLLGLYAVNTSEYLIPFAFFIAIIAVLVRYSMSGEYVAMRALGYGKSRMHRTLLFASVPIALILLYLSFVVYPQALDMSFKLLDQAREEGETSLIQPGQFRGLDRHTTLYVDEAVDGQSGFNRFFLFQSSEHSETVTTASKGTIVTQDSDNASVGDVGNAPQRRVLILNDGTRTVSFFGGKKEGQAMQVRFERLFFYLPDVEVESRKNRVNTMSTSDLLADSSNRAQAEVQRRAATAVSVPLLALLAWLLVSDKPRSSQYIAFAFAILIYLIYTVNQTVVVGLVEKGKLPLIPGGYSVPIVTLGIVLFFMWKRR